MPRVCDGSKFTTLGVTVGTGATALYTVPAKLQSYAIEILIIAMQQQRK